MGCQTLLILDEVSDKGNPHTPVAHTFTDALIKPYLNEINSKTANPQSLLIEERLALHVCGHAFYFDYWDHELMKAHMAAEHNIERLGSKRLFQNDLNPTESRIKLRVEMSKAMRCLDRYMGLKSTFQTIVMICALSNSKGDCVLFAMCLLCDPENEELSPLLDPESSEMQRLNASGATIESIATFRLLRNIDAALESMATKVDHAADDTSARTADCKKFFKEAVDTLQSTITNNEPSGEKTSTVPLFEKATVSTENSNTIYSAAVPTTSTHKEAAKSWRYATICERLQRSNLHMSAQDEASHTVIKHLQEGIEKEDENRPVVVVPGKYSSAIGGEVWIFAW